MKHKVGRPTTTTKVGPPGTKYCKKGEHFPRKEYFKGDDNYCIACRKEYNNKYWEKNNKPLEQAEVTRVEVDAVCHCGEVIIFSDDGDFTCPECDQNWNVNMTMRIVTRYE